MHSAKASSTTIVVPDDYPTITTAIGHATTGDTIYVKSGTYHESTLTINKTLSLIGENANTTIIDNTGYPGTWNGQWPIPSYSAIQINADNVQIINFTISGGTTAIVANGNKTQISGNTVTGTPMGIAANGYFQTITQNTIKASVEDIGIGGKFNNITGNYIGYYINGASVDGISVGGSNNLVYGNTIMVTGSGIGLGGDGFGNVIAKNNLTGCGGGISVYRGSNNTISANIVTGTSLGLSLTYGYNNVFNANYVSHNDVGVVIGGQQTDISYNAVGPDEANNTFYQNDFIDNTQQTQPLNIYGYNSFDNGSIGNYWSDYAIIYPDAIEINHTGIGDTSYVINAENTDHYPLMAPFDISAVTVPLPAWASPSSTPSTSPSPLLSPSPPPTSSLSPAPTTPTTSSPEPSATATQAPSNSVPSTADNNSALQANVFWIAAAATIVVVGLIAVVAILKKKQKP